MRSKLEARWAEFLDINKIHWIYESQGYDNQGLWYLPDFYLPEYHAYLEVKGVMDELSEEKIRRLTRDVFATGRYVCVGYEVGDMELVTPYGGDYQTIKAPALTILQSLVLLHYREQQTRFYLIDKLMAERTD